MMILQNVKLRKILIKSMNILHMNLYLTFSYNTLIKMSNEIDMKIALSKAEYKQ